MGLLIIDKIFSFPFWQVGDDNPINPTINLGAQIGDNGFNAKQFGIFSGLPITPTIGTGINIGDASRGTVTGMLTRNHRSWKLGLLIPLQI